MGNIPPIQPTHTVIPAKPIKEEVVKVFDTFMQADQSKSELGHYDKEKEGSITEPISEAIEEVNEYLLGVNAQLEYRIHEGTKRVMVRLVNLETHETLREMPPEKMLDLVEAIWENVGIIVDKRK
ncbi:flagellar protein FlaG [Lacticigenium naphthae]|uniref:flagellar protein FlaG n=1 Tax=Lacticigenium naphthae TaxID=515351 RepID=UPI00040114EC|nr:flagellar protein FlaG [Lacticigenium naphthae]